MPPRVVALCVLGVVHSALSAPAGAADAPTGGAVRAALLSDVSAIQPGGSFRLAVRFTIAPGWHVNWLNPGDAGLAPAVKWGLPAGFHARLLEWPLPTRFKAGPLVIFGYGTELVLSADVTAPATIQPGTTVDLAAAVSWLECAEACVPGSADVSMRLPVEGRARPDSTGAAAIEDARRRCPVAAGAWAVSARLENDAFWLDIQRAGPSGSELKGVFFFPYEQGLIENASAQTLSVLAGPSGQRDYRLRVQRARIGSGVPSRLRGILVSESGWSSSGTPQAIAVDAPLTP